MDIPSEKKRGNASVIVKTPIFLYPPLSIPTYIPILYLCIYNSYISMTNSGSFCYATEHIYLEYTELPYGTYSISGHISYASIFE